MFQHVQRNIWPSHQALRDIVWCKFSDWISIRFVSNVWLSYLTVVKDHIKFKWRFEFEFEYNKSYLLESFMEQSIPTKLSIILDECLSEIDKEKAQKTLLYKETHFSCSDRGFVRKIKFYVFRVCESFLSCIPC